MNPRVKDVNPNPDHTITLVFTNGEIKRFLLVEDVNIRESCRYNGHFSVRILSFLK